MSTYISAAGGRTPYPCGQTSVQAVRPESRSFAAVADALAVARAAARPSDRSGSRRHNGVTRVFRARRDAGRDESEEQRVARNVAHAAQTGFDRARPRLAARRGIAVLLGTITACVVAAGCGSSSPSTTASSPRVAGQELALSECVRAHGVPDFPDPGTITTRPEDMIGGIGVPSTINTQSPAFRAAWTACQGMISARLSPQGKPQITPALKASMIAHAQCMRTHGVSAYQDPSFPPGGGIESFQGPGVNPQSPAYRQATAACGK
jgi:hypothetical protein